VVSDFSKTQVCDAGITKRELFAAMVCVGILAEGRAFNDSHRGRAEFCVKQADALITELNKESGNDV